MSETLPTEFASLIERELAQRQRECARARAEIGPRAARGKGRGSQQGNVVGVVHNFGWQMEDFRLKSRFTT